MTRDFSTENHGTNGFEAPKDRIDYSKFGLDNDWYQNDSEVERVVESIRSGSMSPEDAASLYKMINEQADMATPDPEEEASTAEVDSTRKLVGAATAIFIATKAKFPPGQPLPNSEFPENEEIH